MARSADAASGQTARLGRRRATARLQAALDELERLRAAEDVQRQELLAAQQRLTLAQSPLRRLHRQRNALSQARAAVARTEQQLRSAEEAVQRREQELVPLMA